MASLSGTCELGSRPMITLAPLSGIGPPGPVSTTPVRSDFAIATTATVDALRAGAGGAPAAGGGTDVAACDRGGGPPRRSPTIDTAIVPLTFATAPTF